MTASAFMVTPPMMSILGANADDMEEILKGLGYRAEPKPAADVKAQAGRAGPGRARRRCQGGSRQGRSRRRRPQAAAAAAAAAESTLAALDKSGSVRPKSPRRSRVEAAAEVAGDAGRRGCAPKQRLKTSLREAAAVEARRSSPPCGGGVCRQPTEAGACRGSRGAGRSRAWPTADAAPVDRCARKPAPAQTPAPAEEPKPILLWRPGRFDRQPAQRHDRRRHGQGASRAAAPIRRPAGRPRDERQRGRPRPGRRDAEASATAPASRNSTASRYKGPPKPAGRSRAGETAGRRDGGRPDVRKRQAAGQPRPKPAFQAAAARGASGADRSRFALRQARRPARPAQEVDDAGRPPAHRQVAVLRARRQVALAGREAGRRPGASASIATRRRRPPTSVKPGDVLTITLERRILIYKVLDAGERRGPAEEARALYEDLTPPPAPRRAFRPTRSPPLRDAGSGRPTKRERRDTDRLRGARNEARASAPRLAARWKAIPGCDPLRRRRTLPAPGKDG